MEPTGGAILRHVDQAISFARRQNKLRKFADSPKFEEGGKVSMFPIASINKQVYDKFADLSAILWAQIKIDSPTYLNFEISYLSPNTDQESALKNLI